MIAYLAIICRHTLPLLTANCNLGNEHGGIAVYSLETKVGQPTSALTY
jgi:hypothetical protein